MDEIKYNNLLSYASYLNDVRKFTQSGTKSGGNFNIFDTPAYHFFKIFFHFHNGDINNEPEDSGLLAPTWQIPDILKEENADLLREQNTAWAYLRNNIEIERSDKLQLFVELLSNINTESPWYFNSISGLDAALERKPATDGIFKIDEERKKISITCLPDAYDTRIGTLLDLYKEIVWSWQLKREILPANLRKFDMSIYIFSAPISNIIRPKQSISGYVDAEFNPNSSSYITSYKYIEFHNCEFDYNSGVSGYTTLNNAEGISPTYTINIFFDDFYENRYNEFIMKNIGDMIAIDSAKVTFEGETASLSEYSDTQQDVKVGGKLAIDELYERVSYGEPATEMSKSKSLYQKQSYMDKINAAKDSAVDKYKSIKDKFSKNNLKETLGNLKSSLSNIAETAGKQVLGTAASFEMSKVRSMVLGNLFKGSLTQIYSQIDQLSKGHINVLVDAANQYTKGNYSPKRVQQLGNLYKKASMVSNI